MRSPRRRPGVVARMEEDLSVRYAQAEDIALEIVVHKARKILTTHPYLDEFVMCMGTWFFTRKLGTKDDLNMLVRKGKNDIAEFCQYMHPVRDFISEWDNAFKLTGTPIRFTATGPVVTNW